MREGKRNNYKFWHSPIALGLIFCGLVFWGYNMIDLAKRNIETLCKRKMVFEELENLKEKEKMLNEDISKLETKEGLEEIIREKLPVVKEGEKMVIITDQNNEDYQTAKDKKKSSVFCNWMNKLEDK